MRKSIVALATATACGAGTSGSTAPTQVTGTIYEAQSGTARSFVAQDAIVDTELAKGFVLNGPAAYVEITDFGSACADEANATNTAAYYPPNGQTLLLGLA
ncbi:MAG: hypothetical protein ACM3SX_10185, partial [Deltaproteobacteria bacterium]